MVAVVLFCIVLDVITGVVTDFAIAPDDKDCFGRDSNASLAVTILVSPSAKPLASELDIILTSTIRSCVIVFKGHHFFSAHARRHMHTRTRRCFRYSRWSYHCA